MVQLQIAADDKLQQMLGSNLRIPANVHPVQTETMTGPVACLLNI